MPADAIREEIRKSGAISFARFMELALYCPETGYYEKKPDILGRRGDFITSVSVGSLFGELLACQFAEWAAEGVGAKDSWLLVEAGAHNGQLARDILAWLRAHRPAGAAELAYLIVEPSEVRRSWQHKSLADFAGQVQWVSQLTDLPEAPLRPMILFANELLDAFPVHRYGWDAARKSWFEWTVVLAGDTFAWARNDRPAGLPSRLSALPAPLLEVLPPGYTVEASPAAEAWWSAAARSLQRGKLLTIDYGYQAGELLSPARLAGTARAYHGQQVSNDLLARPGEQDLTSHVNFSAIQAAGEKAGLATESFCTQPQFLTRIFQRAVGQGLFAHLDARQLRQFQTLTHPEHLGRAFRVLIQSAR